jgi:hypothetical protein
MGAGASEKMYQFFEGAIGLDRGYDRRTDACRAL